MPNLDLRTKSAPKRRSLARARKIAGYSQESLAERLGVDRSTVARWEAGEYEPQPWQRPRIAEALGVSLCEVNQLLDEVEPQGRAAGRSASLVGAAGVLGTEGHELVALLNGMTASRFPLLGERCINGHKFIPVFVGADVTSALTASGQWDHVDDQWMECWRRAVEHPAGVCQLYVWPFGVAVFHLAEDLMLDSVAHLAVWRRISYEQNMQWAHDYLQELTGVRLAGRSYVLSLYWMNEPAWHGDDLCTALRLMCIPRVLVSRAGNVDESCLASAVLAERALIGNGFDHPEIVDFGMKGISLGYASWSGVVYHPIARARALHEDELITCELSVQATWAYCDHLRQQVESGDDPAVPAEFGWRFLRGVRSRLTTERPQETSQHRSMRNAIVHTSGLDRHLAQAVEILRDCGRT
jgi:transcriptional regulator with XRE-family HTH domain